MLKKINESEDLKYSKCSKNTQTRAHPEIPYSVQTQLPPIFSSQLCTISPAIKFLSRSIPNLDSLCWCQADADFTDEAEQALNDQYDRQIADFYKDKQEKAQALKQVFEENLISKLFEETD